MSDESRHRGDLAGILGVESASGERKLIAAMVADAIAGARAGDVTDWQWLRDASLPWLWYLAPEGISAETLRARILSMIPEPECPTEPSEPEQLELAGLTAA